MIKADKPGLSLVLIGIFVVFFFLAVLSFFLSNVRADASKYFLQKTAILQVLSQELAKNASEAANGNKGAFSALDASRREFRKIWDKLSIGEDDSFFSFGQQFVEEAESEVQNVETEWQNFDKNTKTILNNEAAINDIHNFATFVKLKTPELNANLDRIVNYLISNRAQAATVKDAQSLIILAERFVRQINEVIEANTQTQSSAQGLNTDLNDFSIILESLQRNASLRQNQSSILGNIQNDFNEIKANASKTTSNYTQYIEVRQAQSMIYNDSRELLINLSDLSDKIDEQEKSIISSLPFGVFATTVALLSLFAVFFDTAQQAKTRLNTEERVRREQEETNRRNQDAILRLLDELSALADGDLTIQTTVTGEFTGAICDSINFTIEQLRSLVSTINDTAVKVSRAAQETQSTAMQLADASEHQAQEIAGASTAINEIAASIDQVSANAAESSLVAERSVTIANKGSEVVQNTTKGMDTIREQIQETAKRIKRLGESSQEIGDIVSLITDIADQTNILALNAAIQASMAGDAGRGFAVVADEVQRLAERSSAATKQIEAIVRTIQTDTHEAVTSMEHTTAEVVQGTRLAQDAGIALEEIENVSKSLADLIQNISNAARQQAASAGHISNTMNVIQEITSQTSNGTIATAQSIGNLANLAVEMRKTVAGFKLPEN